MKLEQRVAALEKEVARLRESQRPNGSAGREWLDDLYGSFTNDPVFEQAMKLGREYRKSNGARFRKPKRR